jgi:uncharacterized protein (DUF2141 family)
MLKKSVIQMSITAVLLFPFTLHSQPGFTVSGTILLKGVEKTGNLYVSLVTEKLFNTPLAGYKKSILKVDANILKNKKINFRFNGVEKGRYGIRCFLDLNGNGKLDKGTFGPSEPWGMSWQGKKPFGWPKFKYIAFDVDSHITNIRIVVE